MPALIVLIAAFAMGCASKGQATIGDCPDGYSVDDAGNCVDNASDEPGPADEPGTDPDPAEEDCDVGFSEAEPSDNDSDVYWQDDLLFWLDGADDTASVTVVNEAGDALEGTLQNDEGALTWSPNTGLTPDSTHTATVAWCAGEEQISFTTSDLGAPLETDVTGETYALDLGTATWVKPVGIDMFLGDALDFSILLGVEEASDVLDFVGAIPETGTIEQDECLPTLDFDPIDFSTTPFFEIGPVDLPIDLMGVSLTVWSMNISGTFEPDGEAMSEVSLAGALDMREVGPALGDIAGGLPLDLSDPDEACATLTLLGISCEACPSGDGDYCLALDLVDIQATSSGSPVTPIAESDIPEDCE
jgi:hypothetical protein